MFLVENYAVTFQREYYNTLLAKWVDTSIEEIETVKDEIPMLLHMQKMRAQGNTAPPPPKPHGNKV